MDLLILSKFTDQILCSIQQFDCSDSDRVNETMKAPWTINTPSCH
jgi:hypothetical protein